MNRFKYPISHILDTNLNKYIEDLGQNPNKNELLAIMEFLTEIQYKEQHKMVE